MNAGPGLIEGPGAAGPVSDTLPAGSARSLRLRLMVGSALSILVALALAGMALLYIFERHVERRVTQELENNTLQLAGSLEAAEDGTVALSSPPSDPRFELPLSGRYWQVSVDGTVSDSSASLWDETIVLSKDNQASGQARLLEVKGPRDADLIALVRTISLEAGGTRHEITLVAATDRKEIRLAVEEFFWELTLSLIVLGLILMLASAVQIAFGLLPLEQLRRALGTLRTSTANRLPGEYPSEVLPLVDELNTLLASQQRSIERARARAGDLAHGLKTPLTVLNSVARTLTSNGSTTEAADVAEQVEQMRRHVERELARARVAGGRANVREPLRPAVERLLLAMKRLPRGESLVWQVAVPGDFTVPFDRVDLSDLLGNLLDNAREWAATSVRIGAERDGSRFEVTVEDDGPGVPPDKLEAILQRGIRLDESRRGSGLGLAIATDIADAYGCRLVTFPSPMGGLGIRIVREGSMAVVPRPV